VDRPDYFGGLLGGGSLIGGGTGETPLAIMTAVFAFALTIVFKPIAPTKIPIARTNTPSLRDI
jgi:hypothetical protein